MDEKRYLVGTSSRSLGFLETVIRSNSYVKYFIDHDAYGLSMQMRQSPYFISPSIRANAHISLRMSDTSRFNLDGFKNADLKVVLSPCIPYWEQWDLGYLFVIL